MDKKTYWLLWIKAALIRALKTFAQTAAATVLVGSRFEDIGWLEVLSVSGVAFIASILTSLAGLPEVKLPEQKKEEE